MEKNDKFKVILLGVIFDPKERKILLGRRENDPEIPELNWCFPGGKIDHKEDVDKILKDKIKLKTGYEVKNLGSIFSRVPREKNDIYLNYFLCQVFKGEEKPGDDIIELKWVDPEKVESYFQTSFNTRLKEYILNLKPKNC